MQETSVLTQPGEDASVYIVNDQLDEFRVKYGLNAGVNLLVFYQTWRQMGREIAKMSVPLRTYYYYRNILLRDGYLTQEDFN